MLPDFSNAPRILILTGTPPGAGGVGEIILRDLCAALPKDRVRGFALLPRTHELKGMQASDGQWSQITRRYEAGFRPIKRTGGDLICSVAHRMRLKPHVQRMVNQIVLEARSHRPERIWAILDCPSVIYAAREVAKTLGVPLITLVWDAPELIIEQLGYDRASRTSLLQEFHEVLKASKRLAVVGETMRDAYRGVTPSEPIIVRHGIANEFWHPACVRAPAFDVIRLGFAGSITAPDAFETFMRVLGDLQWRLEGRKVILRMCGVRYVLQPRGPQHIEYMGWRTVPETIGLLNECDFLYLPQTFSLAAGQRTLAELSFPTKLSTYVASGRPILSHGPKAASMVPFFQRFPFGVHCDENNAQSLVSALTRMVEKVAEPATCAAVDAARNEELNSSVFLNRFHQFLS